MLAKVIFFVLVIVVLFAITLMGSFYGFQTFYDLRSQSIFFNTQSICNEMDDILTKKNISYDIMVNAIRDEIRWKSLNFVDHEKNVIEQCLQENLPVISSYPISKKIGFLEGVGGYSAKGKANVMVLGQDEYLRLKVFEIGYDPIGEKGTSIPELSVYLSKNDVLTSDFLDLGKLKTNLGDKNYKLPENYSDDYDTVLIYDVIHKKIFAKIKLENLFFVRDSIYNILDEIKSVNSPQKIESRIVD